MPREVGGLQDFTYRVRLAIAISKPRGRFRGAADLNLTDRSALPYDYKVQCRANRFIFQLRQDGVGKKSEGC